MLIFSIIYIAKFEIFFNKKTKQLLFIFFPIDTCVCFIFIHLYCMSSQTDCAGIASILILIVFFFSFQLVELKKKPYLFISIKKKEEDFGVSFVCVDFAFQIMPRGQNAAPTVEQISKDRITLLSEQYWASYALQRRAYDRLVVDEIYIKELLGTK